MNVCLKCGAPATRETRDSEEPMCTAHGGGEPDVEEGAVGPRLTWLFMVGGFVLLFIALALSQ